MEVFINTAGVRWIGESPLQKSKLLIALAMVLCSGFVAMAQEANSGESEGRNRISRCLLEIADIRLHYMAIGRIVDTNIVPRVRTEESVRPPIEWLVRTVCVENGLKFRVDLAHRWISPQELSKQSELYLPESKFLGLVAVANNREFPQVTEFPQMDFGKRWFVMPYLHPGAPLQGANAFDMELNQRTISRMIEGRFLSAEEAPEDHFAVVVVCPEGLGAFRFMFRNDPAWLVDCSEFFQSPKSPMKTELVTVCDVISWERTERTRTEWVKQGERWLPKRVLLSWGMKEPNDEYRDVQVDFLTWKLGKEVDESLVDPSLFSKEHLLKIPFDEWRKEFEKQEDELSKKLKE